VLVGAVVGDTEGSADGGACVAAATFVAAGPTDWSGVDTGVGTGPGEHALSSVTAARTAETRLGTTGAEYRGQASRGPRCRLPAVRQPAADRAGWRRERPGQAPSRRMQRGAWILALTVIAASCGTVQATPPLAPPASPETTPAASGTPSPIATAAPLASTAPRLVISTASVQLPKAVSRAVAFADDGSILLAGGLTASGTIGTIYRVDVLAGSVSIEGHLAEPVHDAGGALVGGVPMVFGGGNAAPERGVQRVGADGGIVGELPRSRADLVVVAIDGTAFVVGGGTPSRLDTAVLATPDGHHFRALGALPSGVRYPAVAVVAGSIVVVGGTDGVHDRSEIETIDPATGAVREIGKMPMGLSHATAFVLDGHLLVAGGRAAGAAQDKVWDIDPTSGTVHIAAQLPHGVSDAAGVVVGDRAYLIGGEGTDFLASVLAISFE